MDPTLTRTRTPNPNYNPNPNPNPNPSPSADLGLLLLGSVEYILHVEHGHEGEDLVGAPQIHALDEHLGERRLHRELGHAPA